jgi:hypothetical protein
MEFMQMLLEEAVEIIDNRNGKPHEDDWDLADAATTGRQYVMSIPKLERVSTKRLKAMDVGECRVFSEPENTKNTGAPSQGFACRANVKITTTACLIVVPSTATTVKAVIVVRVA